MKITSRLTEQYQVKHGNNHVKLRRFLNIKVTKENYYLYIFMIDQKAMPYIKCLFLKKQ